MVSGPYCQYSELSQENYWPGQMLASVVGVLPWPCWLGWVGERFSCLNAALFWYYVLPPSRRLRSSLSPTSQLPALCECLGYPLVELVLGSLNWNLTPHCLQSGSGHLVHVLTLNIPHLALGVTPCQQGLTANVPHWQTVGNFPLKLYVFGSWCQLAGHGT